MSSSRTVYTLGSAVERKRTGTGANTEKTYKDGHGDVFLYKHREELCLFSQPYSNSRGNMIACYTVTWKKKLYHPRKELFK